MTAWRSFDAASVHALAPSAVDAFRQAFAEVDSAFDPVRLELIRRRIDMILGLPDDDVPALAELSGERIDALSQWPTATGYDDLDRTLLAFAEQFVMDVAGVTPDVRGVVGHALGADGFGFVQALYLLDHGSRLSAVVRQLFGESPLQAPTPASGDGLWPALEAMMTAVITIGRLDPLTAELVRLRGARAHDCRLCQSRRRVAAVSAHHDLLEDPDPLRNPALRTEQRAALRLTDAILRQPGDLGGDVIADVQAQLDPTAALEVALLVAHNAANKIAVAFGADAPVVASGTEFFEVDAAGVYTYGLTGPSLA